MNIDVYSANGTKKGTLALPEALFAAPINKGLMHQYLMLQQSNRRAPIAHAKSRGEVVGSTRKLFQQKGTGRARRGPIRSPLMRGGGKAFGPKSIANFTKNMPKAMRHAALRSCLSLHAKSGSILGLENYGQETKTKAAFAMLSKMPVELGRHILIVLPERHEALKASVRNIPGVKAVLVNYLNPEDILISRHLVFITGSLEKAVELFGKSDINRKVTKKAEKKTSAASAQKSDSAVSSKKKSAPKKKVTKKTA